jgi:hypothetical protein
VKVCVKGGLISERRCQIIPLSIFSLEGQGSLRDLANSFGDLSQREKLSEIKLPLKQFTK